MSNPLSKYGMIIMALWFTFLGFVVGWIIYA